jgi:hypothetical protein
MYSFHARNRLAERSITERMSRMCLKTHLNIVSARCGRHAMCGRLSNKGYLAVIYEEEGQNFIVVIAVKLNKEGTKSYGFTGV